MPENAKEKEIRDLFVYPLVLFIKKRQMDTDKTKNIYYFDVGLYPKAARFYITHGYLEYGLGKFINQINKDTYLARFLSYADIKYVGENKTPKVVLGDNILMPIGIKALNLNLKEELEKFDENLLIDYYVTNTTDGYRLALCLFKVESGKHLSIMGYKVTLQKSYLNVEKEE